jgi:hypothetical protein
MQIPENKNTTTVQSRASLWVWKIVLKIKAELN